MGLALTEDHVELERVVDQFVERHGGRRPARESLEGTAPASDTWSAIADLGWLGLHLPEDLGGSGFGLPELAVVVERLGRVCWPGPFIPTVVVSGALSTDRDAADIVATLADGSRRAGLCLDNEVEVVDGRATGRCRSVIGGSGVKLVAIVVGDDLVVTDALGDVKWGGRSPLDAGLSSDSADLSGAPCRVIQGAGAVARNLLRLLAASDAAGGAGACREMAVAYATERVAFDRPIGSFQAIKHACADLAVNEQMAIGAAWDAARSVEGVRVAAGAAAGAAIVATEALRHNAKSSIQIHGGIGYTWEHDAHLFLRRASAWHTLIGMAGCVDDACTAAAEGVASFHFPPAADELIDEVSAFRAEWLALGDRERVEAVVDAGYLHPSWPPPWGRNASVLEQLVVDRYFDPTERHEHLGQPGWTLPIILPTVMRHGTPDQQDRWIRPTMLGEVHWCQLFSEPGAGSDLAALTTRAERADGGWLVTGQKVWTSSAHEAELGFALVRTDRDAPKHRGITAMVIDMAAPGVTIRPLQQITGDSHFNEVFLDEVFVPDTDVVGDVNGGWGVAVTTLGNERVSLGDSDLTTRATWAVIRTRAAGLPEPDRTSAARVLADKAALTALNHRIATRAMIGGEPGVEGNLTKLVTTGISQRASELAFDLLGADALFADDHVGLGPDGTSKSVWYEYFQSRSLSIAGGTSEILRNIIAERVLGLPREAR